MPDNDTPDDDLDPTAIFARRLWQIREGRGLTLAKLAGTTELSLGHLSKLERGLQVPTVKTIQILANAFGLEVVDFVVDPDLSLRHAAIAATAHMTDKELAAIAKPKLAVIEGGGGRRPKTTGKKRRVTRKRQTRRGQRLRPKDVAG